MLNFIIFFANTGTYLLQQKFIHAAFWNAFNVFLYKIILQIHQTCLFYVISKELFGISGILFSTIYFLISLTNFGFDYSLFAFHQYYSSSQKNFKIMMQQFMLRSIAVLFVTSLFLIIFHYFSYLPQIFFIKQYAPTPLITILALIFISESMKKSLELFAHLSFLNKTITILEIISLLAYTATVWVFYFFFGFINLYVIFTAMCMMSLIELNLVLQRLNKFKQTLPLTADSSCHPTRKTIFSNQCINYINQIAKALFSPNFIIIFLAYHLGMIKAGYIKLIIDSVIVLYMLLNRAVGIPSGALMSQRATLTKPDLPHFSVIFLKITNAYIQFLYTLLIISSAVIIPCIIKSNCSNTTMINIVFFAFTGFLEYLMITYEKLYLTQKAAHALAIINISALTFLIPALWFSNNTITEYLLLPFVIIRLISFVSIAYLAYTTWNIKPYFYIKLKTIFITLLPFLSILALSLKY